MPKLSIRDLIDAVTCPCEMFSTLRRVVPARDVYGETQFYAGRQAIVFKVVIDNRCYALKCYTAPPDGLDRVFRYVAATDSPLLRKIRFLPKELYVFSGSEGQYIDIVLAEWIEGAIWISQSAALCIMQTRKD